MWRTRLTDCLRMFTGCRGRGLRIAHGFLPDLGEEAYGLFPDFYRIWGRRLTDCLRIFTGFGGGGLRIVYGFLPALGEDWGKRPCGLFLDWNWIWGRRLTDLGLGESGCWNLEATASFSLCSSPLAYIQLGQTASYFHYKIDVKAFIACCHLGNTGLR